MPRSRVSFHIQQGARPEHIERILRAISPDQSFDANSLHHLLAREGYDVPIASGLRRCLDLGQKLEIFKSLGGPDYVLTTRGQACRSLALFRRDVYNDIMHYLLFAMWELNIHKDHWSWSYAKLCEILWRSRPDIEVHRNIFGELSEAASEEFPDLDPVVGTETVSAVLAWLKQLSPPFVVIEDDKAKGSQEREWFSIELALLAVSYLYAARRLPRGTPILLDSDTLGSLCPLCLTSADSILAMIETASRTYPVLELHAGEWGSSAILKQPVDIPMLT